MKKKIFKSLIMALIFVESFFVYLSYRSFTNKKLNVNVVKYTEKDILSSNKTFAFMIYDEEKQTYTESASRASWPSKEEYAYTRSECYDGEGNVLIPKDVFNFNEDTLTATITSGTTLYCRLFFDKTTDAEALIIATSEKGREGASGSLESGNELQARNDILSSSKKVALEDLDTLRRFVGDYNSVKDNFICFGVDDKNDCLENLDQYMYRIIGIDTEHHQIKVIKATKIGKGYSTLTFEWHNTKGIDISWEETDIYKFLNSTSSTDSYFLGNTFYSYMQQTEGTTWTDLIVDNPTWNIGIIGISTLYLDVDSSYAYEVKSKLKKEASPIGLITVSDMLYAYGGAQKVGNWLFIGNGLNGTANVGTPMPNKKLAQPAYESEWTISHHDSGVAYVIDGYVSYPNPGGGAPEGKDYTSKFSIRPVFYLKSNNLSLIGKGTIENPYLIVNAVTDQ